MAFCTKYVIKLICINLTSSYFTQRLPPKLTQRIRLNSFFCYLPQYLPALVIARVPIPCARLLRLLGITLTCFGKCLPRIAYGIANLCGSKANGISHTCNSLHWMGELLPKPNGRITDTLYKPHYRTTNCFLRPLSIRINVF